MELSESFCIFYLLLNISILRLVISGFVPSTCHPIVCSGFLACLFVVVVYVCHSLPDTQLGKSPPCQSLLLLPYSHCLWWASLCHQRALFLAFPPCTVWLVAVVKLANAVCCWWTGVRMSWSCPGYAHPHAPALSFNLNRFISQKTSTATKGLTHSASLDSMDSMEWGGSRRRTHSGQNLCQVKPVGRLIRYGDSKEVSRGDEIFFAPFK